MQPDWRKRHLGLFAFLAVLLIVGTLVLDFLLSQSVARDRASIDAVEREIGSLQVALADFRAAQAAYVATGQGPEFWVHRAGDLVARLESGLTQLRESSATEDTRATYQAALGTLANLVSFDKKARDHVQNDQLFLAADVVFVESLEGTQRLAGDLERLRTTQSMQVDSAIARTNWLRFAATAFTMGVVLAVALRVGKPAPVSAASEAALTAQMIRDLPPAVKPAAPPARPSRPPPPPAPAVNLPDAAELCVDLARVIDSRDVPALLERAAQVLDAKGVIVWMADAPGGVLRPSLAHGYAERVLNRLGTLEVEADNVTSLAFRSVRPQIMPGALPGEAGAVAVPLVTAAGCSGVFAAELRDSKPAPELLALTRIIAAQFATLIAPVEFSGARAVEG